MGSLDTLPEHVILKILWQLESLVDVARFGIIENEEFIERGAYQLRTLRKDSLLVELSERRENCPANLAISRRWYYVSRNNCFWQNAEFSGKSRLSLRQLTSFVKSPLATRVTHLSLEGYVVRATKTSFQSTITNHVLIQMDKRMENLRSLKIENANISNIAFKCMPKSLERLSLIGSIIGYCAMDDLAHPATLPRLRQLNLDYVHNLSSNSKSFQYILRKKDLVKLEVRHCNRLSNYDLMKISDNLVNLRVLNLSEIRSLNDLVLEAIAHLKNLAELFLAFTAISDEGIYYLSQTESKLVLLDIRGCPRITGQGLMTASEIKSLREIWIFRLMSGGDAARELLRIIVPQLMILDEVDRRKMALPQKLDHYSMHFANAFVNKAE